MANSNNRDVRMTLSVDTLGAEDIQKLQASVASLAKQGGDAAPEFQRLADEIGRLGEQAKAVQNFSTLAAETATLVERQDQASASAAELRARLEGLSTTTQEAAGRQAAVAAALATAQAAARATRDELATLVATTDRAGKSETSYANAVERLKLAKISQRAEIERLSSVLSASNAEVKEAEKAERELARAYAAAEAAASKAEQAVRTNATAVRDAAESALDLGISTDNIAAAQAQLVQELNRTGRAAQDLQSGIDRLADAERELAGIRAFEEQAEAAAQLRRAAEYANFWEQSLRDLAETERQLAQQQADERWQREAEAIVEAAHAAQRLARETEALEAAQRELAAQQAFERQAEDARRLIEAADYVREWEEQLQAAERQARETAEAGARAGREIADAFSTLGTRSATDLEQEIAQVRQAMRTVQNQAGLTGAQLESAFNAGNARIQALQRELRRVNGELTTGDRLADLFSNSLGQIAAGNIIADGVGYLVNKVKELAAEFVKTIVETQNLRRALTAVYKDSAIAAQQFEFLKKTANNAGVAIGDIVKSFVKFSAATKASGINLEVTNKLFAAVTRSAGILGLSGEQVTGTLEALGQMASKGTVSMEELRQQLGDRLPGALSLVAKGLGLTEAELIRLVEAGGLAARDLFPALTSALGEMSGETTGLSSSWQRFKNILTETAQSAGDAGWTEILSGALKVLGVVVGALAIAFSFLNETLGVMARTIGVLISAVVNLTNPMEELSDILKEAANRHDRLTLSISNNLLGIQSSVDAAKQHKSAMEEAGEAAAAEALAITTTAKAQEAQAFAAKLAANSTLDLSSKLVQIKAHIDALLVSQVAQIEAEGRLAKAAKIQGDSLIQLAALRGKDFLSLEAQVVASDKYAVAVEKVALAQRTETELLVLKREEIVKTALAQDGNLKARKVEIELIEKKIIASRSETEQTLQAAAAARQDADQRRLNVETYKDNAGAVGEFKKALEEAEKAVKFLTQGEKDGYVTREQVVEATHRAAEAAHLYNDAIKDSIAALDLETRAKQANMNLTQTKLEIEQRNYQSLAQAAKATGDFVMALYYEVEAKRRQIEITRLVSEAKKIEAEATIKGIEIERAALDQSDPLIKQKKAELDIRLANAKAKLLEAEAGAKAIEALEREITALQTSYNSREQDTKSRHANADAVDRQTLALQRKVSAQYDEQNFALDTEGNRINATGEPAPYVGAGGDWVYVDSNGQMRRSNQQPVKDPRGGYIDPALMQGGGGGGGLDRSRVPGLSDPAPEESGGGTGQRGTRFGDPLYATGPRRGEARSTTVNISINGRNTAVGVSSDDDAAALTSVLRQLEDAAGRST